MESRYLPIGVFDSGVGGLTVAREIFRNLPNERIIYYGDTARVPYGNKSKDTVIRYSRQIAAFLLSKGVKALVIACNTASSLALDAVQEMTDIPVIGVVKPGAEIAVRTSLTKKIGVIGTSATISSGLYDRYITELLPDAEIFGKACPLFVNLVEEGMIDDSVTIEMIHRYLDGMIKEDNIDTLVLGCTHYPLLMKVIAREIGGEYAGAEAEGSDRSKKIKLVNPAYTAAKALESLLKAHNMEADKLMDFARHEFYVSDAPEKFREFSNSVMGLDIHNVSLKVLV